MGTSELLTRRTRVAHQESKDEVIQERVKYTYDDSPVLYSYYAGRGGKRGSSERVYDIPTPEGNWRIPS